MTRDTRCCRVFISMIVVMLSASCATPPPAPTGVPGSVSNAQSSSVAATATVAVTATAAAATSTLAPTATAAPPASASAPTATVVPLAATNAPAARPAGSDVATTRVDLDKIFPPGKGRDLALFNCTGCHTWVRLVIGQRTLGAWQAVRRRMAPKASGLSPQEIDDLFGYLEENFNDTKPVPAIPDWLLNSY